MKLYAIASILLFLEHGNPLCSSDENPDSPYRYYSWMTLYDTVSGKVTPEDRPQEECTPIHFVMIARHASRYPGEYSVSFYDGLEQLTKNLNTTGKAKLCPEDLEKIKNWTTWYNPEDEQDVAPTGVKEMTDIARRYTDLLPEIFAHAGSKADKFRFIGTLLARTHQSAEAFAAELFKDNSSANVRVEVNDRLLRFLRYCQKYLDEVENNATATTERDKYEAEYMIKVAENFADNLGIPRDQFGVADMPLIVIFGCAFEEWATGIPSPWCLALSVEDFQAYEYRDDLHIYLTDSYGYELNYQQACELRYFVLSALKNASLEESPSRLGHFGFTHGSLLVMLLTSMNIIQDEGFMRAEDYEANANRTFRLSFMAPGSGHVAFVLYKCGESNDMKLQIFHNEKLVKMPLGDPTALELWDLDDALAYYHFDDGLCDFDGLCRVDSSEDPTSSGETEGPTAPPSESTTSAAESTKGGTVLFSLALAIVFPSIWKSYLNFM